MNLPYLPHWNNFSPRARLAVAATACAGTCAVAFASGFRGHALLAVLVGVIAVALVLAGLGLWFARRDRRAADDGDRQLTDQLRAAARVADPELRARAAAMVAKLVEGLARLHACGLRATDQRLPWYLIVGEPGSGKTEAIRHSGLAFPPGLNEERQGSGGTLNMDWWFTERGIFLDTAGRLVVPENEFDSLGELRQFLTFLKRVRPHPPINGMILVIPADSLAKDAVGDVERKSGQIAKRLDVIRRTLGVRFPVYVMITKSDLLPGFRGFFADCAGPRQQRQILGWSNPAPLDAEFDPARVDQYLEEVRDRLRRRRMRLLLDPVHTGGEGGRRIEEVDDFFEFPDALAQVAPNLRLYLQRVFFKGTFSPEPPFLRGIYFTSAVEEGAELDEALARLRGISVAQLQHEGARFRRERAVFLTDLFDRKIGGERGLVFPAAGAERLLRRNRALRWAAGCAAAALLTFMTWSGQRGVSRYVAGEDASLDSIKRRLDPGRTVNDDLVLLNDCVANAGRPFTTPLLFRPFAGSTDRDVNDARMRAYAAVYRRIVLGPLVSSIRKHLKDPKVTVATFAAGQPGASPFADRGDFTRGLATLIGVESARPEVYRNDAQRLDIPALVAMGVRLEGRPLPMSDVTSGQAAQFNEIQYRLLGEDVYPAAAQFEICGKDADAVRAGMQRFIAHWKARIADSDRVRLVTDVTTALSQFDKAEDDLRKWNPDSTSPDMFARQSPAVEWAGRFAAFHTAANALRASIDALRAEFPSGTDSAEKLIAAFRSLKAAEIDAAVKACEALAPAGAPSPVTAPLHAARVEWAATRLTLNEGNDEIEIVLRGWFDKHLAAIAGQPSAIARFKVYEQANEVMTRAATSRAYLAERVASADERLRAVAAPSTAATQPAASDAAYERACRTALAIQVWALLEYLPRDAGDLRGRVEPLVAALVGPEPARAPQLPFTPLSKAGFDPRYEPERAVRILRGLRQLDTTIRGPGLHLALAGDHNVLVNKLNERLGGFGRSRIDEYVDRYVAYWQSDVLTAAMPVAELSWALQHARLNRTADEAEFVISQYLSLLEFQLVALRPAQIPSAFRPEGADASATLRQTVSRIEKEWNELKDPSTLARRTADCRAMVKLWAALPVDAAAARDALLRKPAKSFHQHFVLPAGVVRYWKGMATGTVKCIADHTGSRAPLAAIRRELGWTFPLFRPAAGDLADDLRALAPADVSHAQAAIDDAIARTPAPDTYAGRRTLGQGVPTGDDEVDEAVDVLRHRAAAGDADHHELLRMKGLLGAITPPDGDAFSVVVSIPRDVDQAQISGQHVNLPPMKPAGDAFPNLIIDWPGGGAAAHSLLIQGDAEQQVTSLNYGPAAVNHVALSVRRSTTERPEPVLDLKGPWAAFELLHRFPSFPAPDKGGKDDKAGTAGKAWLVRIEIPDGDITRALWLKLVFQTTLAPTMSEWPPAERLPWAGLPWQRSPAQFIPPASRATGPGATPVP